MTDRYNQLTRSKTDLLVSLIGGDFTFFMLNSLIMLFIHNNGANRQLKMAALSFDKGSVFG